MSASFWAEDWSDAIETTYNVVKDSSQALDKTIANTLGIRGLYEVNLLDQIMLKNNVVRNFSAKIWLTSY